MFFTSGACLAKVHSWNSFAFNGAGTTGSQGRTHSTALFDSCSNLDCSRNQSAKYG